jgi:hypothetical protein
MIINYRRVAMRERFAKLESSGLATWHLVPWLFGRSREQIAIYESRVSQIQQTQNHISLCVRMKA